MNVVHEGSGENAGQAQAQRIAPPTDKLSLSTLVPMPAAAASFNLPFWLLSAGKPRRDRRRAVEFAGPGAHPATAQLPLIAT